MISEDYVKKDIELTKLNKLDNFTADKIEWNTLSCIVKGQIIAKCKDVYYFDGTVSETVTDPTYTCKKCYDANCKVCSGGDY